MAKNTIALKAHEKTKIKFTKGTHEDVKAKGKDAGDIYVVDYDPPADFDPDGKGIRPMAIVMCPSCGQECATPGMKTTLRGNKLSVADSINCPACGLVMRIKNSELECLGFA